MQKRMPVVEVIDDRVAEIYRKKSPGERVMLAMNIYRNSRLMMRAFIKDQHPDWSHDEISKEIARRFSGGATENAPE